MGYHLLRANAAEMKHVRLTTSTSPRCCRASKSTRTKKKVVVANGSPTRMHVHPHQMTTLHAGRSAAPLLAQAAAVALGSTLLVLAALTRATVTAAGTTAARTRVEQQWHRGVGTKRMDTW